MRYLLTENGLILRYNEENNKLWALRIKEQRDEENNRIMNFIIEEQWLELFSYKLRLSKPLPPERDDEDLFAELSAEISRELESSTPPLPPERDEHETPTSAIMTPIDPVQTPKSISTSNPTLDQDHGVIQTESETQTQFIFMDIDDTLLRKKLGPVNFDDPQDLRKLWENQELRARAGKELKAQALKPSQSSGKDADLRKALENSVVTSERITKCAGLIEFAQCEIVRLRRPCKIRGKEKALKIETALIKLDENRGKWKNKSLRENAFILQAHECGLIEALNWHRISWSRKAKNHDATTAIKNLEEKCPGIAIAI